MTVPRYVYLRMCGYVFTISIHITNIIYTWYKINGVINDSDPLIKTFNDLQVRYFTSWTLGLQVIYSAICLFCDWLVVKSAGRNDYWLPKWLVGLRDILFAGIQWPSNLLVFTVFWSLFLYDRRLIFPVTFDLVISKTSNHILHTLIVPIVLWEVAFRPRAIPKSHKRNIAHMVFHVLVYLCVLLYTYYERGHWLYPIFGKIYGTIWMPVLMLLIVGMLLIFYHLQWYLTRLFWGDLTKEKVKKML